MDIFAPILAIIIVHIAAVMAPGANFLVVTKNSLSHSRPIGLSTATGVATGTFVWVTIGFFGFAVILSSSPLALTLIKIIGTAYFLRTAYKTLTARPRALAANESHVELLSSLSGPQAYSGGLLTSLANPASAVYFLSLFTTFIPTTASLSVKLFIACVLVAISQCWYSIVAMTFSNARVRSLYARFERVINLIFGVMWFGLALRLALS